MSGSPGQRDEYERFLKMRALGLVLDMACCCSFSLRSGSRKAYAESGKDNFQSAIEHLLPKVVPDRDQRVTKLTPDGARADIAG